MEGQRYHWSVDAVGKFTEVVGTNVPEMRRETEKERERQRRRRIDKRRKEKNEESKRDWEIRGQRTNRTLWG